MVSDGPHTADPPLGLQFMSAVRMYLAVWLGFALFSLWFPARGTTGNQFWTVAAIASYLAISSVIAVLVIQTPLKKESRAPVCGPIANIGSAIVAATGVSYVGLGLVYYDRAVLHGVDFLAGLGAARYAWLATIAARQGQMSSAFSVIGNPFSNFCYIPIILIHLHAESLGKSRGVCIIFGLLAFLGVIVEAALMGGRTPVLILGAALVSTGAMRRIQNRPIFPGSFSTKACVLAVVGSASLGYATFIFSSRAANNDIAVDYYNADMIAFLNGEMTDSTASRSDFGPMGFLVSTGGYLVHSTWSFQLILGEPARPGRINFAYAKELLGKLKLTRPADAEEENLIAYRFISVPGALWYDYGLSGFLFGALLHGLALGAAAVIIRDYRGGAVSFAFAFGVLVVTAISPMNPAYELSVFPYMLVAIVAAGFTARFWWGRVLPFAPLAT